MIPSCMVECRNAHILYLCERMRPDEIEQYLALTGNETFDPEVAARGFMGMPGHKFTVLDRQGFPAASGGYYEVVPGVYESWMVGTMLGWETNWRSITKATRWLMNTLLEGPARRLQTTVLASRVCATDWYRRSLKLQHEGVLRGFGRNGENAALYARVRE